MGSRAEAPRPVPASAVGRAESLDRQSRRTASIWFMWPLVVAIPIIASMAVFTIGSFRQKAASSYEVAHQLLHVRAQATHVHALTWQALAAARSRPALQARARSALASLDASLKTLDGLDLAQPARAEVERAGSRYLTLIAAEVDDSIIGAPNQAIDARTSEALDAAYTVLQDTIASAAGHHGELAERTGGQSEHASMGTLALALLGIGLLFLHLDRARQGVQLAMAEQTMLRRSEERFRSLVQNASDGVLVVDVNATILYASGSAQRSLGDPPEGLVGKNALAQVHPEDAPVVQEFFAEALCNPGVTHPMEFRFRQAEGDWRHLEAIASNRLFDPTVKGIVINLRDVTGQKAVERALRHSEEALRQSQKMEAIGRLAGGVAHDFNNMLAVINGYAELMLQSTSTSNPAHSCLSEIKKAGDRAADLTRQLLAFSRKTMLAPQVLDLNLVVSDLQKLLLRLIGEDIELVTLSETRLGRVKADRGQLEQVIMNLAVNARDAMPRGGTITIATTDLALQESDPHYEGDLRPGAYILLSVTDTGCGMDRDTLSRVFEPFFTTKEGGKGTGLGLATVYGIIKQSGGDIEVESSPGNGATFRIYLPRVEAPKEDDWSPEAHPRPAPGHETVLLVEDEEMLRKLVHQILTDNGYRVLAASSGPDALRVCEELREPLHLLLTDVVMPGMSGRELSERICALRPGSGLKTIYMSGYTDDAIVRHGVQAAGTAFIQKPFTADVLIQKVRELLDPVLEGVGCGA